MKKTKNQKPKNILDHPNFKYLESLNVNMSNCKSLNIFMMFDGEEDEAFLLEVIPAKQLFINMFFVEIEEYVNEFFGKLDLINLILREKIQVIIYNLGFYVNKFQLDLLKIENKSNDTSFLRPAIPANLSYKDFNVNVTSNMSSLVKIDVHFGSHSYLMSLRDTIKFLDTNYAELSELILREILTPVILRTNLYFYKNQLEEIEYILFHGEDHSH